MIQVNKKKKARQRDRKKMLEQLKNNRANAKISSSSAARGPNKRGDLKDYF